MADISQIDIGEMTREYGEEKITRLMNEIVENNVMMLKLQKQIVELQEVEGKKRRQIEIRRREEERTREQEETDKWMEECRKRRKKGKEESRGRIEKNRKYEKKEGKESRERVEISGEERKKEGREQTESNRGK